MNKKLISYPDFVVKNRYRKYIMSETLQRAASLSHPPPFCLLVDRTVLFINIQGLFQMDFLAFPQVILVCTYEKMKHNRRLDNTRGSNCNGKKHDAMKEIYCEHNYAEAEKRLCIIQ